MPVFTPELIARHAATVEQSQPPPKPSHARMHVALGVLGAGQVADAATTIAALGRDGTHEGNAIYGDNPSALRIAATKAAVMVPTAYALDKLYDQHPKLAQGLALGIGALGMGLAAHNAKAGR